ncbi:MAG TPA: hypothetical protein VJP80_08710, partial [Candidatus Saccharimonadales bacterium]|nr:hypothetical protein [Candidatus Saccharimonadales bacterium]
KHVNFPRTISADKPLHTPKNKLATFRPVTDANLTRATSMTHAAMLGEARIVRAGTPTIR